MFDDILEKGAILQRDKETFAIAPHIPGGITNPEQPNTQNTNPYF